jgi:hypothetical protein
MNKIKINRAYCNYSVRTTGDVAILFVREVEIVCKLFFIHVTKVHIFQDTA